jgi:hypothetical protein
VSLDQRGEGQFPRLAVAGCKPLQWLAVGQRANRPNIEQNPEMLQDGAVLVDHHVPFLRSAVLITAYKRHELAR